MRCQALELFSAKSEGDGALYEPTVTSIGAGSMAELLSLLKARASTGGWRVALITPNMLQELREFRGANPQRQNGYEDLIVDAGVKDPMHSLSEYVFGRTWVQKALLQGKMPVVDGTGYPSLAHCLKGVRHFLSCANQHGSSNVCLVAVTAKILQSLASRVDCVQSANCGGIL